MKSKYIETVVLIHDPIELKIVLKKFPQSEETLYCTLSPYASDQCEKEEISYIPLEDFSLNADSAELKEKIHQSLLATINLSDKITQKHHSKKSYISPYRASLRRLAVLLAGTRIRIHYLSALISETRAKKIIWFGKPAQVLTEYKGNKAFSDYGSVEIALLKFQKWEGIDLFDYSSEITTPQQNYTQGLSNYRLKQHFFKILKKWDWMHSLNFLIKMLKASNLDFLKCYFTQSRNNILIESYTPFWLEVCRQLLRRGNRIHNSKNYSSYLENWKSNDNPLEKELNKALFDSEIFNWNGINWTDFIFPLIKHLSSLVDPLTKVSQETKNLVVKHKIKCLLTIGAHREYKYALIQGAKFAGAKIITFQHGGFGSYGGIYMGYDDLNISDFHICPGPGDVQSHQKINPNFADKCKPLGFTNSNYKTSDISKKQMIKNKSAQQTLLYMTTHYQLNHGIFLDMGPPWKDSLVFKDQKTIILGLKKIMRRRIELKTVMKLHPDGPGNNMPSMGKDFEDDRFTVFHMKPDVAKLMSVSDVLLIDSPTTAVIQAVATRKPLFILTSNLKLFSEAKKLLAQRAVVRDEAQELIKALEDYFLNEFYPADINNTEFLSFFSDPFGDGLLHERAVELVIEACPEHNFI